MQKRAISPATLAVLVVEDEFLIRMLAVDILREHGCVVWEASHVDGALTVLHQHAESIDALLTDITMPGPMDGVGLAHYAAQHWPWIRTLIVSARPLPDTKSMPPGCRFLAKPYDYEEVYHLIRDLTDT